MARKTIVEMVDDLDGTVASTTVDFALDGVAYEIDLNDENAAKLREEFSNWTENARRIGGRRKSSRPASGPSDASEIRTWAKENGIEVPERGRISATVREAYAAAH